MKQFNILTAALVLILVIGCSGKSSEIKEVKNRDIVTTNQPEDQIPPDTSTSDNDTTPLPSGIEISSVSHSPASIPWKLNKPDKAFKLSFRLKEVSGLTYDQTASHLLAINDEQGIIYRIDPDSGKELANEKFGKKGDYEGIQMVGEEIYVLKSNGHIYRRDETEERGSELIRTDLRSANDAEGLSWDPVSQKLLLACKGKTSISSDQKFKKSKVVYGLDLNDLTLVKDPYLIISDQELEQFVQSNYSTKVKEPDQLKDLVKRAKSFAPSGIAYRNATDQFFIISSIGKTLVVLDRQKKIVAVHFLDKSVHAQPEGICFDDEDRLYIANEGKFGIARIYRYNN